MTILKNKIFLNNKQFLTVQSIFSTANNINTVMGNATLTELLAETGNGDVFNLTFFDGNGNVEIVSCTNINNVSFTEIRAREGTAQFNWPIGTSYGVNITAKDMQDVTDAAETLDIKIDGLIDTIATIGGEVVVDSSGNVLTF